MKHYESEDGLVGMGMTSAPWDLIQMQGHVRWVRMFYSELKGKPVVPPELTAELKASIVSDTEWCYKRIQEEPSLVVGNFREVFDALIQSEQIYFGERNTNMQLDEKIAFLQKALVAAHRYIVVDNRHRVDSEDCHSYEGLKQELFVRRTLDDDYTGLNGHLLDEPLVPEH